ncbi:MAG: hypothetical protein RMK45_10755, partial [Armatimonadota bacterium]|nr:hypothetical protein [Armatimonadota bacterium]
SQTRTVGEDADATGFRRRGHRRYGLSSARTPTLRAFVGETPTLRLAWAETPVPPRTPTLRFARAGTPVPRGMPTLREGRGSRAPQLDREPQSVPDRSETVATRGDANQST